MLDIKQGKIEVAEQQPQPPAQTSARPTAEMIRDSLKAYVATLDPQRCCSIERGPARDRFGVFAVLRMDGSLTLRSWDRETGRWY